MISMVFLPLRADHENTDINRILGHVAEEWGKRYVFRRKPAAKELPPHVKVAMWRAAMALLLQNSNRPDDFLPVASLDSLTMMGRR